MKHKILHRIVLLFAFIGFSVSMRAQYENLPFVVKGKEWLVVRISGAYREVFDFTKYVIGEDSVSNGKVWNKVLYCKANRIENRESKLPLDTIWGEWSEYGWIREENGKVFLNEDTNEIYNFNLNVSDTIHPLNYFDLLEAYPTSSAYIDSISFKYGLKHLFLSNSDVYSPSGSEWIEGVGDISGPFEENAQWFFKLLGSYSYRLVECRVNNRLLYQINPFPQPENYASVHEFLPIISKGKRWENRKPGPDYEIGGDTIIGGVKYCKLITDWGDASFDNAYFRELNGRLYRYWTPEDLTIFDFNHNEGDTILLQNTYKKDDHFYDYQYVVVKRVYDVIIESSTDKQPRRCMDLELIVPDSLKEEYPVAYDKWVEGIGSMSHGITGTVFGIVGWLGMQKVFLGDTIYYAGGPLTPADYLPTIEYGKTWITGDSRFFHYIDVDKSTGIDYGFYPYVTIRNHWGGDNGEGGNHPVPIYRSKTATANDSGDSNEDEAPLLVEYVREEDGRIYKLNEDTHTEYVLIDYTLKQGDVFNIPATSNTPARQVTVTKTYQEEFGSEEQKTLRRCLDIQCTDDPTLTDTWVEGLGSLTFALNNIEFGTDDVSPVRRIMINDTMLYDIDVQMGIENTPVLKGMHGNIYSLDGCRLQRLPEKGLYIVNGRKVVRK